MYFALRDLPDVSRASVWMLDPYWLNTDTIGNNVVIYTDPVIQSDVDREIALDYLDYIPEEEHDSPRLPKLPLAISPPNVTSRIDSQNSCFTIHGWKTDGFGDVYRRSKSPRLVQLRISDSAVENIKYELGIAGISESTLFPDLDGLARDLRVAYGFRESFRK